MINFFRKIRLRLMVTEQKTKYLKYALGEIILVVIGILIALSINNWNELRKLKKEEQSYLLGLKEEFNFNLEALKRVSRTNENNVKKAIELLKYTGPDSPNLTELQFDSLLWGAIVNEVQYLPSPGVINEITNAGKLGNFSDKELKKALASWESVLTRIRFQEQNEVLRSRMEIIDFVNDKTNIRRAAHRNYGALVGFGPSKFKGRSQNVLQMAEFENRLLDFVFTSFFLSENYYPQLNEKIEEILKLIEKNIDIS